MRYCCCRVGAKITGCSSIWLRHSASSFRVLRLDWRGHGVNPASTTANSRSSTRSTISKAFSKRLEDRHRAAGIDIAWWLGKHRPNPIGWVRPAFRAA